MNYIADIYSFWKHTWDVDKTLFFAEMIGAILALTSATILSFGSGSYLMAIFITYIISNLCLLYAAHKRQSSWLMVMSLGFLLINIIGIVKLI